MPDPTVTDALRRLIPYIKLDANGNLYVTDVQGNTVMEVGNLSPPAPFNSSGLATEASFQNVGIYPPGGLNPNQVLPLHANSFGFPRVVSILNTGATSNGSTVTHTELTQAQMAPITQGMDFLTVGYILITAYASGSVSVTANFNTEPNQDVVYTAVNAAAATGLFPFSLMGHMRQTQDENYTVVATPTGATLTYYFNTCTMQLGQI